MIYRITGIVNPFKAERARNQYISLLSRSVRRYSAPLTSPRAQ